MFCHHCGQKQPDSSQFCHHCGTALGNGPPSAKIGYSARITDPRFAKYVKESNQYAAIFSGALAVIAVVGFYIYGETSREMENPEALYIGLAIGSMFLAIAAGQIIKRNRSKTWDGIVINKTIEQRTRKRNRRQVEYTLFTVFVERDSDKKVYVIAVEDDDTIYGYYQIGDKVRHHGGLGTFEKYDKSKDTIIFCNACSTLHDIQDDQCFRCHRPLLK